VAIKNDGISIIICCYNSATRLPQTLYHVSKQKLPDKVWGEVVLIDNASTDNTAEVAEIEWKKYDSKIELRIIEEKKPGLINARMKGIEEAKHEIIIFCDDDNWLLDNYLLSAWKIMRDNRRVGALGGEGFPVSSIPLPDWFEEKKGSYACGKQWDKNGVCTRRMYLWGSGLVTRRSVMGKVFFEKHPMLLTGRKEGVLLAGDDNEICRRIVMLGYDLYYSDLLRFKHFIDEKRLNIDYFKKMRKGIDISNEIIQLYHFIYTKNKYTSPGFFGILVINAFAGLLNKVGLTRIRFTWSIKNYLKLYKAGINKNGRYHSYYRQVKSFYDSTKNDIHYSISI
jgi:glycosyltransferase involved in cell wall biosynthesis